jgi:hypothetical protein
MRSHRAQNLFFKNEYSGCTGLGRGQGNGTARAPEDMADIHRNGNIWRGFNLVLLNIDVQNILRPTLVSLTPLTKGGVFWVMRAKCNMRYSLVE